LGPGFPEFSKEEVSKITIPALLVSGENSPRFFKTISDKLHDLLPNSTYFVIPGVSHNMHVADPEVFNEKVLEFLNIHNS
jgi:pimeloyl-ACP methyl ester carboxylesterase